MLCFTTNTNHIQLKTIKQKISHYNMISATPSPVLVEVFLGSILAKIIAQILQSL